jgi:hypothetical protein
VDEYRASGQTSQQQERRWRWQRAWQRSRRHDDSQLDAQLGGGQLTQTLGFSQLGGAISSCVEQQFDDEQLDDEQQACRRPQASTRDANVATANVASIRAILN